MTDDDAPDSLYLVVVNDEEQYSIWPSDRTVPLGWRSVGEPRTKTNCLAYIQEVWTDMRPLSVRRHMQSKPERS